MRDCERRSREAREKIAGKRFARRVRDRVQQAIERAPFALQRREQRVDVVVLGDVAAQHRCSAEFGGDLDDAVLEVVVDIGERERCALTLARARDLYSELCGWHPERIEAGGGSYLALELGRGLGGGMVECRTHRSTCMISDRGEKRRILIEIARNRKTTKVRGGMGQE